MGVLKKYASETMLGLTMEERGLFLINVGKLAINTTDGSQSRNLRSLQLVRCEKFLVHTYITGMEKIVLII